MIKKRKTQKNKWKSKRWKIVFILEEKYIKYKDADIKKLRPVLIWNNSLSLNKKSICFYCTSKYNEKNKFLYKVLSSTIDPKTKRLSKDTYVDLSRIFFIKNKDIQWKKVLGTLKEEIKLFLNKYFHYV